MKYNKFLEDLDLIESDHKKFSIETPLREDAFELSDQEKIDLIKKNVGEILHTLGMDMTDDSLKGTPLRVAKAYVNEVVNHDTSGAKIYYHQTDSTGFTPFSVGNTLTDEGGQTGTIAVVADSNELYFLEVQPTYATGFSKVGYCGYFPPFYNPSDPELVKFILQNKSELEQKIPLYYFNWLDKNNHFKEVFKELKRHVWS